MEVLKYYMFDWDDNILHMKTPIHVNHNGVPVDIVPAQYPEIRSNPEYTLLDHSFEETTDTGPRGQKAFQIDVMEAVINLRYAPSWDMFIEAILNGRIFLIITARGHEPDTIKIAVKTIIGLYLSNLQRKRMVHNLIKFNKMFNLKYELSQIIDQYLDRCEFLGVASEEFQKRYNVCGIGQQPGPYKVLAIKDFIQRANTFGERVDRDVVIGFSDDDSQNVKVITKYLKSVNESRIKGIYVYDTSDPDIEGGLKKIVKRSIS